MVEIRHGPCLFAVTKPQLQLPSDMAVAVSANLGTDRRSRVDAPALSGPYLLALAAEQSRSIVAFNATP
jgi:hypothetical protein